MSSISPADQTLLQSILRTTRAAAPSAASTSASTRLLDAAQTRQTSSRGTEMRALASLTGRSQAAMSAATELAATADQLVPKLRQLGALARQAAATGLTTEQRQALSDQFTSLQQSLRESLGSASRTLPGAAGRRPATALPDAGPAAAARPSVLATNPTTATPSAADAAPAGTPGDTRNPGQAGVTALTRLLEGHGRTAADRGTSVLALSVASADQAEAAASRLAELATQVETLQSVAQGDLTGQSQLLAQAAQAMSAAAGETELTGDAAGGLVTRTAELLRQAPALAMAAHGSGLSERAMYLLQAP
jgi:hypothetical protein